MSLAPIVLFVYNRPEHTEETLNALAANGLAGESDLYIYSDGPKQNAPAEDRANIEAVRQTIRKKDWCKSVSITESPENLGLANSIIKGVSEITAQFGKAIVLEDDVVPSAFFLSYMNRALDLYEKEQEVISIGSFNFFATDESVDDTLLVSVPDCWGWATWRDRWDEFEPNAQLLLDKLRESSLIDKFNLNGAFDFESMLADQIKGNISSWAIRWQAVAFLDHKLCLYPKFSVTKNTGFSGGGTHGAGEIYAENVIPAKEDIKVERIGLVELPFITEKLYAGYKRISQPNDRSRFKTTLRNLLKQLIPPFLLKGYRKMRPNPGAQVLWQGNYTSWSAATADATGYDAPLILEKTKNAILKVKNGFAAGERDSVLFDQVEYTWPVTAYLLKFAMECGNELNVIDFGGALGSSYFQNKKIIPAGIKINWNVVEQKKHVEAGNKEIAENGLRFFYSVNEALKENKAGILLLSGVIQYLEEPYKFLNEMFSTGFKYIIVDRTPFIDVEDRIVLQTAPASIYKASYPSWFFNRRKFKAFFVTGYKSLYEFNNEIDGTALLEDHTKVVWECHIFEKRKK